MANNTGATCVRCGKGHYKAFDLNDDIFGDLRCDTCRDHVKLNQDLMAEPTPLSPAAQAVLDAAEDHGKFSYRQLAAAALRAAADQVVPVEAEIDPLKAWSIEDWNHMNATKYQQEETRRQLLAIAAELDGSQ